MLVENNNFIKIMLFIIICFVTNLYAQIDKKVIYWRGNVIVNGAVSATEIANRGFTEIVLEDWKLETMNTTQINNIKSAGLSIIVELTQSGYSLKEISPFTGNNYEIRLAALENFILTYKSDIIGIVDDMEICPHSVNYFTNAGLISTRWYYDYSDRITNSGFDSRVSFKQYIGTPYNTYNLTNETIRYNFPKIDINNSDNNNLFGFILGYVLPGYEHGYQRVIQTFKPNHSKISRIDVRIKRYVQNTEDFTQIPPGEVIYYLAKTNENGEPLFTQENKVTQNKYLRTFDKQTKLDVDYLGGGQDNFGIGQGYETEIQPTKLYFDPNDFIEELDITKEYALVLEYSDWEYQDCNNAHYRVASKRNNPYSFGKIFKFNGSTIPYNNEDLWFNIYYPDPPYIPTYSSSQINSNARIQLLGYSSDHYKMAQTFITNTSKIASVKIKIEKIGISTGRNFIAYICETDASGIPNNNILSSIRIFGSSLISSISEIELPFHITVSPSKKYAIVLEFEGEPNSSNYYHILGSNGNPYPNGKLYKYSNNNWIIYDTQDFYFKIYDSPGNLDVTSIHDKWLDYQVENNKLILQDYQTKLSPTNLDLYIYSGYNNAMPYGETIRERYGMDWSKVKNKIDYAMSGYGFSEGQQANIISTYNVLEGKPLIGGVEKHDGFFAETYNFNYCNGGVMYAYWGTYDNSIDGDAGYDLGIRGPGAIYHPNKGEPSEIYTWNAAITGGTYKWYWNNSTTPVSTSSSYSRLVRYDGTYPPQTNILTLNVIEATGSEKTFTKTIMEYCAGNTLAKTNIEALPEEFVLNQNYPNPFNPTSNIKYALPEDSRVKIKIYDILGKEVAELVNEEKPAGRYEVEFNASSIASGIYFYRIQAGSFVDTKKMILMK